MMTFHAVDDVRRSGSGTQPLGKGNLSLICLCCIDGELHTLAYGLSPTV